MQLFVPKGRAASFRHTETSSNADITSVSEQETLLDDITSQGLRGKDIIDRTKPPGWFFFSERIICTSLYTWCFKQNGIAQDELCMLIFFPRCLCGSSKLREIENIQIF